MISYICSDHFFIQTHSRNKISTRPKVFSREVLSSSQLTRYCYRTFTFDKTHYMRYRELGCNTYAHVDVIQHQMAFYNLTFFLICKIMQHFSYMLPELAKYQLLSPLGYKYHMIFTIPARMAPILALLPL